MNKQIKEQIGKVEHLWQKREDLQQRLKRSLMIQEMWPDAFKNGGCKSFLSGNFLYPDLMRFTIKNGKGETMHYGLRDVPRLLLMHHIEKINPGLSRNDRVRLDNYLDDNW